MASVMMSMTQYPWSRFKVSHVFKMPLPAYMNSVLEDFQYKRQLWYSSDERAGRLSIIPDTGHLADTINKMLFL